MKFIVCILIVCAVVGGCQVRKINLDDYPVHIDYGTLNELQREAFDSILAACEANSETADIPKMTQAEFDEVVCHLCMHFGAEFCKNIALKRGNTAKVNLEIYEKAMDNKAKLDREIDTALSKMLDGSAKFKLQQISKWIANNAKYRGTSNEPSDLLDKGALCGAYAMLFYKMATRIGVKAYICRGYSMGSLHSWNMVEIDGKKYFYDVTYYDTSGRMSWYLHSNGWGREYTVNEKK